MEKVTLVRIGLDNTPFLQYLPRNMWKLLEQEETICVGAVFRNMACAVALAEGTAWGEYYLRYIFVDPTARLCGLGTYLLEGLLGEVEAAGASQIKAIYSPSMLESGGARLSILERAGFSKPKAISTSFSIRLGDIRTVDLTIPEGMEVYSAAQLPLELSDVYESLVLEGELPAFTDIRDMVQPSGELSSFCTVDGKLSGLLLVDQREWGLHVAALYVMDPYRGGRTAAALIARTIRTAKDLFPAETEVSASAINRDSFALCEKLLHRGASVKETELMSAFVFRKDGKP